MPAKQILWSFLLASGVGFFSTCTFVDDLSRSDLRLAPVLRTCHLALRGGYEDDYGGGGDGYGGGGGGYRG